MKEYGTVGKVVDPTEYYASIAVKEKPPEERVYEELAEQESEPHDALTYARDTLNDAIVGSDYFIETELALTEKIDTEYQDSSPAERARHLLNERLKLIASVTNEYLDQDANRDFFMAIDGGETYHSIRVLGNAPYALRQQVALDHARSQSNNHGVEHAKATVVTFNHQIAELVEQNPKLAVSKLASEIELAATAYDHTDVGYAHNAIQEILVGVRTEGAFAQAIEMSPTYKYRRGDIAEDRQGIDGVVTLPDETELGIDLKSSMTGVTEKAGTDIPDGQPFTRTDDKKFAYYLGTREEDFVNGTFTLDHGAKIRMKNVILQNIQKMSALE